MVKANKRSLKEFHDYAVQKPAGIEICRVENNPSKTTGTESVPGCKDSRARKLKKTD